MSHLLMLLLLLCVVLAASKFAGALAVRMGQPAVFGKILAGLLLGPTLLDIMNWHIGPLYFFGGLPPEGSLLPEPPGGWRGESVLHSFNDLAEIGVLLLMFMAGLETDLKQMRRVGRVALFAALGGVVLPFLLGLGTAGGFSLLGLNFDIFEALFIGTILTATSVSISAQTLMELGRLRSREGAAILGAAVIDDVVGIVLLSVVIAFKPPVAGVDAVPQSLLDWIMLGIEGQGLEGSALSMLRVALLVVLMLLFFALAISAERWLLRPLLRRFERLPVSQGVLAAALLSGFLYAWAAQWIGNVAAITGTYLAGVLIARSPMHREVEEKLHVLTYGLFVPVFFVSIGLTANARPIFAPLAAPAAMSGEQWLLLGFTCAIIAAAILSKVLGAAGGASLAGFDRKQSLRTGVGMISRGEVGIIIALVGLNAGIIGEEIFSIMVLMVLLTTLVTPLWLKRVFGSAEDEGDAPSEDEERREAMPET